MYIHTLKINCIMRIHYSTYCMITMCMCLQILLVHLYINKGDFYILLKFIIHLHGECNTLLQLVWSLSSFLNVHPHCDLLKCLKIIHAVILLSNIAWRFILQEILSGFGFTVISVVSGFWFGFSPWNPPKETHSNSHSSSWTRWFSSPSLPLLGWKVLELDAVHAQRLFHGRYTYGCTMATSRTPWDSTNEIFIAPSASRYGWHCKTTILALLLHQQTNLYHHMNFGANSEKLFPLAMS